MNNQLNNQHIQYFRQVFHQFDQDSSNQITKEELRLLMGALGENLSQTKIDELINEIDTDGDGVVDEQQFLHLMQIIMKRSDPEEECRRAFNIFDRDGNGTISALQLRQVMMNLGGGMTETELQQIFVVIGREGKEQIDEQDFMRLIMERKFHHEE